VAVSIGKGIGKVAGKIAGKFKKPPPPPTVALGPIESSLSSLERAALNHFINTPANRKHAFARKHNLAPLVEVLGSRSEMVAAVTRSVSNIQTFGVFNESRVILGQSVTITGLSNRVTLYIGNFWIP
jgi:hypothetical protein